MSNEKLTENAVLRKALQEIADGGNNWSSYRMALIALDALSTVAENEGARDARLSIAIDALDEIALAGMSGSGQESEEGMREWHARQAWRFIGIAARAKEAIAKSTGSAQ